MRLPSHRDRALVAFYVSTGARASELLSVTRAGADPGRQLISMVRKGSRVVQELPASTDAFVWLRLYQVEMAEAIPRGARQLLWWTRVRCARAGVPDERGLLTKPHLGVRMLMRALSDPALVFRWVVADSGYGRDPVLRAFCHDQRLPYVLAVPVDRPLVGVRGEAVRPDTLLADTDEQVWQRRSCGHGSKGERY